MKPLLRIITTTSHLRKYYVAVGTLTVLVSILGIAEPYITGRAIDEVSKGSEASVSSALVLAGLIFLTDVARNLINNVNGYFGDILGARLQKSLSERYYNHLLHLPKSYFDDERTGKIINKLERSVAEITSFIHSVTNNFLQFIVSTLLALVAIAIYSWVVALLLLALYPIYVWLTARTSPRWMEYQGKVNKSKDAASGRFAEAVSQIEVVKSFTQEKRELQFYQANMDDAIETTYPQSRYWHKHDIIRRLALNVIFFAVFAIIFTQAASGNLSPGEAVAVLLYAAQIRIPIFTISFLVDRAQRAVSDSKDYFEVLDYPLEPTVSVDKSHTKRFADASIKFESVGFAYADSKKQVLNDVSFDVAQGKTIALVGKSGEGKSTLINLLMGLYEPSNGTIVIGKTSVKNISNHELRSNIAAVFQTPSLFSGTIFENISYAKPNASEADVIAAAKAANAHDFIQKLDNTYQAEIGERGVKLSGGQKQRISIARALLKDAPILILDEATSSLDATSEVAVQSALNRLMEGRTTIVIAHRLSTIQAVDEIVVIDGGEIVERGTPKELATSGGIYTELLELQDSKSSRRQELLKKYELG